MRIFLVEGDPVSGLTHNMKTVLAELARWRIQTETRLRSRVAPSLAIVFVLVLITAAIMWSFEAGRSPGQAACVIGIAAFGGMFLIAAIGAGMFMARKPEQIIEQLLGDPARTFRSRWKMALLAEAKRCLATAGLTTRRVESIERGHEWWPKGNEVATSTSE
jgi:hypothetical protein